MSGSGSRETPPAGGVPPAQRRSASKLQCAEAFLANLRSRSPPLDVDAPGFGEGIRQHFESLPSRCARAGGRGAAVGGGGQAPATWARGAPKTRRKSGGRRCAGCRRDAAPPRTLQRPDPRALLTAGMPWT